MMIHDCHKLWHTAKIYWFSSSVMTYTVTAIFYHVETLVSRCSAAHHLGESGCDLAKSYWNLAQVLTDARFQTLCVCVCVWVFSLSRLIHISNLDLVIIHHRLEEKLSDMECEDQILRQQTLLVTPIKRMSEHLAISPIKVVNYSWNPAYWKMANLHLDLIF